MDREIKWIALKLNPQPWAIGPLGLGRKKGGGFYPTVAPNAQLVAYQNAIREALVDKGVEMIEGEVEIKFYFSRAIESSLRLSGRRVSAHTSDTTNMQKATEDALQGFLIKNDRDVVACSSVILDQGPEAMSFIVIRVTRPRDHREEIPSTVWDEILKDPSAVVPSSTWQPPSEDDF